MSQGFATEEFVNLQNIHIFEKMIFPCLSCTSMEYTSVRPTLAVRLRKVFALVCSSILNWMLSVTEEEFSSLMVDG